MIMGLIIAATLAAIVAISASRLTQDQRAELEERCVRDYFDRMDSWREERVRDREEAA